jgi:hypothetical protein
MVSQNSGNKKLFTFIKNKGNKYDPNNFRPITILSCLGKLFTYKLGRGSFNILVCNIIFSARFITF